MRRKTNFFISIILSFTILLGIGISVSAVEPRYSDTHSVSVSLIFDGTTAYCECEVEGAYGTDSIDSCNLVLKDSNGNKVASWTGMSSSSDEFYATKIAYNLTKGETYTLSFSANVHRNGKTESVSNSISKTCPKK